MNSLMSWKSLPFSNLSFVDFHMVHCDNLHPTAGDNTLSRTSDMQAAKFTKRFRI